MIKTHIAASGMHAGEYVPCRIAGKNEHIHFADEESIQEFNEFNDEVQRNIWQEESDDTDNIHTMMSTLQSGSTVDKDEYESVLNAIKNSSEELFTGSSNGLLSLLRIRGRKVNAGPVAAKLNGRNGAGARPHEGV